MKQKVAILLIIALLALTGCEFLQDLFGVQTDGYEITIITIGQGVVVLNPDAATFSDGEVVELTATPAAGWIFSNWEGDAGGSDNPLTVIMDSAKTITAVWETVNLGG